MELGDLEGICPSLGDDRVQNPGSFSPRWDSTRDGVSLGNWRSVRVCFLDNGVGATGDSCL